MEKKNLEYMNSITMNIYITNILHTGNIYAKFGFRLENNNFLFKLYFLLNIHI